MSRIGELINNTAAMLDMDAAFTRLLEIKKNGLPRGISTGWPNFDKYFQFPPTGQLSVLTGTPWVGKSEWFDSLSANMIIKHNWKVFVYSPENYPADFYLQKMCEKMVGKPMFSDFNGYEKITDDEIASVRAKLKENLAFVDCHINNATVDNILNAIFQECMLKRVNMAIIDPWNKLESQKPKGMSSTEFIGHTLTRIQMFARQKNISFWIIAHPAKPLRTKDGNYAAVTLYDVSDSANWYNMVDNGFILVRDKKAAKNGDNKALMKIEKIKDRRYGKCGECWFEFEPATGRYKEVAPPNRATPDEEGS